MGYEGLVITGELVQNIDTQKFLPIIRANDVGQKMPTYLGATKYIDFSNDDEYAVLSDPWFVQHAGLANTGLATLGRTGAMELRFALHDPISKSQLELLNAVRESEIHTFGWPIAVTLESRDEFRPRPAPDGIIAEVNLSEGTSSGRTSYDYWTVRNNGDFYLLQSLFEDDRATNKCSSTQESSESQRLYCFAPICTLRSALSKTRVSVFGSDTRD